MRKPHQLFDTPADKAALETRNGLLQFEAIGKMVDASKSGFAFTPDTLRDLHRIAIKDIYICAGNFRTANVVILRGGIVDTTKHQPPHWDGVIALVDEMCEYVNGNLGKSAVHLAAYVMWRVNWIHPFMGGNGRTSRAVSYLLLNFRIGFNLPGIKTIAQQIETDRLPYYEALREADAAALQGTVDVSAMEELISRLLAVQLLSVHGLATGTFA